MLFKSYFLRIVINRSVSPILPVVVQFVVLTLRILELFILNEIYLNALSHEYITDNRFHFVRVFRIIPQVFLRLLHNRALIPFLNQCLNFLFLHVLLVCDTVLQHHYYRHFSVKDWAVCLHFRRLVWESVHNKEHRK